MPLNAGGFPVNCRCAGTAPAIFVVEDERLWECVRVSPGLCPFGGMVDVDDEESIYPYLFRFLIVEENVSNKQHSHMLSHRGGPLSHSD